MAQTLTFGGTTYAWTQCGVCGVWYTVPEVVMNHHRAKGGYHYCPSGHAWGWKEGNGQDGFDLLRRERDREAQADSPYCATHHRITHQAGSATA